MYRPQNFDEVMGQNIIISELKKRSVENTLPHVSIFAGSTGTGKTTTAFILAASINCRNKKDGNPCGTCPSCKDIFGEHFDRSTRFIDASAMGKEDIVNLSVNLEGASLFGEKKIVIIDEAQELSSKAFGACLRLLENKDENLYFILCTMNPEKIDRAILSRGTVYKYKPLDFEGILDAIANELKRRGVFDTVPPVFVEEGVVTIAENCHGSVREAMQYLDRALASELYTTAQLESELDLTESSTMREMVKSYLSKSGIEFLLNVRKLNSKDLWAMFTKAVAEAVTRATTAETLYSGNDRLVSGIAVKDLSALENIVNAIRLSKNSVGYEAHEVIVGALMATWFSEKKDCLKEETVVASPVQPVVRRRVIKE